MAYRQPPAVFIPWIEQIAALGQAKRRRLVGADRDAHDLARVAVDTRRNIQRQHGFATAVHRLDHRGVQSCHGAGDACTEQAIHDAVTGRQAFLHRCNRIDAAAVDAKPLHHRIVRRRRIAIARRVAQQQHRDLCAAAMQMPRHDQAIAAIVAAPANDQPATVRDGPAPRQHTIGGQPRRSPSVPFPGCHIRQSPCDPSPAWRPHCLLSCLPLCCTPGAFGPELAHPLAAGTIYGI